MSPLPYRSTQDVAGPFGFSLGRSAPSIAAAQRASLGRGLVFVLLLAASSLASAYAPYAFRDARWVEGTAAPRP